MAFAISSRYYFFIELLLDNLNSNSLINLSEGDGTVESGCFTCIIICLQFTSIMYNFYEDVIYFQAGIIDLFSSCLIYYMYDHFFLFQGSLKTNNYIEILQIVLVIIL